jgi:lambda family phage portal protein
MPKQVTEKAESIYNVRGKNDQTRNYQPYYPVNPNVGITAEITNARNRANGLYFENPVAAGIVNALVDGVIGTGLQMQSSAKYRLLKKFVTKEQIAETQRTIEALWDIWCKSPMLCDHYGKQTFGQLQREAYIDASVNGDVLQHIKIVKAGGMYLPQIQNISGKSVNSPNSNDTATTIGGVEVDSSGRETGYHIDTVTNNDYTTKSVQVPKFGGRSGRLMYNLVALGTVVPGQKRGRSVLTRVTEQIIQIGRYSEAEIVKAILQSYMTLFIETEKDAEVSSVDNPITNLADASTGVSIRDSEGNPIEQALPEEPMSLAPGAIYNLPVGQKANLPESKSPVAQFGAFMEAQMKLVGMAVGIPYEVLIKSFNSSYSASQASMQDAARGWGILCSEWASKYCQPIYEQFVDMMLTQKLIECKGYSKNIFFKSAWLSANWFGPAILNIDPRKNAQASETLIKNKLSTHEIEARSRGLDWETIIEDLGEEQKMIEANGLGEVETDPATTEATNKEIDKEDEEEDKK